MEFKIDRNEFLSSLITVQRIVEKRNTMPVLSNVFLEVDKNGLKLLASDLEVFVVCQSRAQVIKPGRITVPARSICDIVREIPEGDVLVRLLENDRVEVKILNSQFNIPGLSAKEYPEIPKVEVDSVEMPCEAFRNLLEKCRFAMSTDETRHNLAGILLENKGRGLLKAVATDGHRLAVMEQSVSLGGLGDVRVIIPRKGVMELSKMVQGEGSFEIGIGKKNVVARRGNETLYVRLIDGDFPDYTRVIPEKSNKFATVPKQEFIGALRRVSLLANERSRGVVLNFSTGLMEVSINNPDLGEAKEEFPIEYRGERLSIGFNARYFLDILDIVQDEKLILALQSDLTPCIIKTEKESGFLCVIMPMRI